MSSSMLPVVYATDEDVYVEGGADFKVLMPDSNLIASGTDGVFSSGDPWTLTSASNDFAAQGMAAGMVVQLTGPPTSFKLPQYLAAEAVSGGSVTLRRCGMPTGMGMAPSPAGGLSGVTFACLTFKPQIENTAFKLNEQYSVDPNVPFRTPGDIYEKRVFRRLTALRVLYLQYQNKTRTATGDFAEKIRYYLEEYDRELATATLRWGNRGVTQPATTRFNARLGR
jgi:hypothetical protein